MGTEEILATRSATHGDFVAAAQFVQSLKQQVRFLCADKLDSAQQEGLDNIAQKIGRIVFGDPDCADHWDDIAGYAKLVSRHLTGV